MDPSANLRDERINLKSRNVSIKNRSFSAYLTNKRLILLDSDDPRGESSRDIDRQDIVMARTGEDLSGTPTLNLSIKASNGEIKRMIITFIGAPEERNEELSNWVTEIREGILSRNEVENQPFGTSETTVPPATTTPNIPPAPSPAFTKPEMSAPPSGQFAFCPNCGEKLISKSRFCHACGGDLGMANTGGVAAQETPPVHKKPEQPPVTDPLMHSNTSYGAYHEPVNQRHDPVAPVINDQASMGGLYEGRHDPMGYPHPPPGAPAPAGQKPPGMYQEGRDIGYQPVYDEQKKRSRQKKQKVPKQKKVKPQRAPKVKKPKKGRGDAIYGYPDYGYQESGGKGKIIGMAVVGIIVIVVILVALGQLPFLKLPVSSGDTPAATPVSTVAPDPGSTTVPDSGTPTSPSAGETELTNVLDSFISAFNSNNAQGAYSLYSDSVKSGGVTIDTIQEQIDEKLDNGEMIGYNVIQYYPDGNSLFIEITTKEISSGSLNDVAPPRTISFEKDGETWKINWKLM